jgi:hypothetical protein
MRTHAPVFLCAVFLLCCSSLAYCDNHQIAIGDLNGDGKPDIVVVNPTFNNIGVFLNTGGGTLGPGAFLAVPGRPDSVSLVDLNSDGHLDILLVVADISSATQLQAMLGDGKGGFAAPVVVPTGGLFPISNTVIADFNGDGFPDIAFGSNGNPPQIAIIFGDGHGGFSAPRVITVANDTTGAAELVLLDANKDSKPDLVVNTARVASIFIHESFLLLNDGTANFSVSRLTTAGFSGEIAGFVTAVADFNGDGFSDLLFGPGTSEFIMFGDGHGGTLFTSPQLSSFTTPQGFAADIDGNQTIDLVSSSLSSYFPGNGHGGFGDPLTLVFPQGSTLIAVADFNGDGKPDFVLQSGTNICVLLNSLTAPANISASTGGLESFSAATTSVGLPVTLVTSLISYGGVPTGTFTLFEGAQSLGSVAVNAYGGAALTTSFSTAGLQNNLSASFVGTLDAATNTVFGNLQGPIDPVFVNSSQPTASAPTVSLSAFPNPARVRNPVTISATVTGSSGTPTGRVVFMADGNVLGISPLLASGSSLIVTFPGVGLHNLQATYGGDATFPQATSPTFVEDIRLSVPGDFTMAAVPQSATIKAGQTATFTIILNPVSGMNSAVTFGCTGLPAASSCTFSPASLIPNGSPVATLLTINTTAPSSAAVPVARLHPWTVAWPVAIVLGLVVTVNLQTTRKTRMHWRALAAVAVALCIVSCGGGGTKVTNPTNGTPPGISSITVTAISATSHTAALTVTVTP